MRFTKPLLLVAGFAAASLLALPAEAQSYRLTPRGQALVASGELPRIRYNCKKIRPRPLSLQLLHSSDNESS